VGSIDEAIRGVAIFRALPAEDRSRLAEVSVVRSYDKAEALFAE
jgi:hypothetical protein